MPGRGLAPPAPHAPADSRARDQLASLGWPKQNTPGRPPGRTGAVSAAARPGNKPPKIHRSSGRQGQPRMHAHPRLPPSFIRTVPSAPGSHRIVRSWRSRALPPIGNWALRPSPCPEGYVLSCLILPRFPAPGGRCSWGRPPRGQRQADAPGWRVSPSMGVWETRSAGTLPQPRLPRPAPLPRPGSSERCTIATSGARCDRRLNQEGA
jgi:hypothetical protein